MKKMKKILFVLLFVLLSSYAFAQGEIAKANTNTPAAKKETPAKSPAPIILDKVKLEKLRLLQLEQENAQLKADAAIPQELKTAIKNAGEALNKFWSDAGVKADEKYERSEGVDGAIILTPVKKDSAAATPAPKP